MSTQIWMIRHGETAWNATGRWQGNAPVPLSDVGLAQSAALGHYLAAQGVQFAALYSSNLTRAMQTAQAVAAALHLDIRPEPLLREVDLGDWQGMTREEAMAWDSVRFAAFHADPVNAPHPNGESRRQLQIRARTAFDHIATRHRDQTVALVSHGGTLGTLVESLFGKINRPSLSNTSLTIVEQEHAGTPWRLVQVAWTPHLNGAAIGETW